MRARKLTLKAGVLLALPVALLVGAQQEVP